MSDGEIPLGPTALGLRGDQTFTNRHGLHVALDRRQVVTLDRSDPCEPVVTHGEVTLEREIVGVPAGKILADGQRPLVVDYALLGRPRHLEQHRPDRHHRNGPIPTLHDVQRIVLGPRLVDLKRLLVLLQRFVDLSGVEKHVTDVDVAGGHLLLEIVLHRRGGGELQSERQAGAVILKRTGHVAQAFTANAAADVTHAVVGRRNLALQLRVVTNLGRHAVEVLEGSLDEHLAGRQ